MKRRISKFGGPNYGGTKITVAIRIYKMDEECFARRNEVDPRRFGYLAAKFGIALESCCALQNIVATATLDRPRFSRRNMLLNRTPADNTIRLETVENSSTYARAHVHHVNAIFRRVFLAIRFILTRIGVNLVDENAGRCH